MFTTGTTTLTKLWSVQTVFCSIQEDMVGSRSSSLFFHMPARTHTTDSTLPPAAVDLTQLPQVPVGVCDGAAMIVLDGTWAQAKSMLANNVRLHHVRQVCQSHSRIS